MSAVTFSKNEFQKDNFNINFSGIIIYKSKAGIKAIEHFLQHFQPKQTNFNDFKGNFILEITNTSTKTRYILTDNSGIYRAYYNSNSVSDSFLSLLPNEYKLNYNSILDFINHGIIHNNKTLFEEINILPREKYITIDINNKIEVLDKNLTSIDNRPNHDFFSTLSETINILNKENISLDLTGGIDSRLIIALFNKENINYETALSGLKENSDIQLAETISESINKPFHPTFHTTKNLNKKNICKILEDTDGQIDVLAYHRNYLLNLDRKNRNVKLQIGGVGGELYKDFWWLQDFPFYSRKKSNIKRLYRTRINSANLPKGILNQTLEQEQTAFIKHTINQLQIFQLSTNTKTYDNIYYNYKMRGTASAYLLAASRHFDVYAPLLELDIVRYGFNLNRSLRFFNNFHREAITQLDKKLAQIKTTEGISCSSEKSFIVKDILGYINNKLLRFIKVLIRKTLGYTTLQESPNNKLIYDVVRQELDLKQYENILQENKILHPEVNLNSLPNAYLGRFLTLAMILKRNNAKG